MTEGEKKKMSAVKVAILFSELEPVRFSLHGFSAVRSISSKFVVSQALFILINKKTLQKGMFLHPFFLLIRQISELQNIFSDPYLPCQVFARQKPNKSV